MILDNNKKSKSAPTQLIIQALSAAEASISLAKQLLAAQSGASFTPPSHFGRRDRITTSSTRDLPGIVGKFDGEKMVAADGKTYPVPTNYAGKSKLVFGDALKMLENADGTHLFKQIEKVARKKVEGKLVKKSEQWWVTAKEGEYRVLNSNVKFLGGQEGDETSVLIPENDPKAPWAAIDAIPVRDAERRSRRTAEENRLGALPATLSPEKEKDKEEGVGFVGKLLGKVTAQSEKKEKAAGKKEEKTGRKPRQAATKAVAESKNVKEKEEEKENVPTPPPVEDEGELR